MGSKEAGEMQFWTKDEYPRFSEAISDKPLVFYAFEVLYWMGIRYGKLMALTSSMHEMDRGCKASSVKRICIHDLRYSHVSLLINMGFSALEVAERVGHEAIDITYRCAHLFPAKRVGRGRRALSGLRPPSVLCLF